MVGVALAREGVAIASAGQARILPWPVAAEFLADPALTVVVGDDLPVHHLERILAALAVGDAAAAGVAASPTRE
ncbi:MAG: hypothetical protein H0W72_00335, partial [Planctomycetes bacterium]|nr:hypothetical protein [Planctomycetota bacterium]